MDTQIRLAEPAPVVAPETGRTTLSLPQRAKPIAGLVVPAIATSIERLREAILRCATEAQSEEKTDTDARLHCFIAKLSGCMETMGEVDMDHALWDLMKLRAEPPRRVATGSATGHTAKA
jgi:hypothetical protein